MIDTKIEIWKKRLLDLGKRNRLLNYKETKRSNLKITEPNLEEVFNKLVIEERELCFPHLINESFNDEGDEFYEAISEGNIKTDRSIKEQQKTLTSLRNKARTAIQEQGINILYLCFGFLNWKENYTSETYIKSPLVLVPVSLTIQSVTEPFVLHLHEDEIVVNPTLLHKLENDFGVLLPNFDQHEDDLLGYLKAVDDIAKKNNWEVIHEMGLSLLSFLKINMYNDLENNVDKIKSHPILRGLSGDIDSIEKISDEYDNYDHDNKIRPIDMFQIVDADSSQQDAILYSKKNISFVLQGPPGTGKSQTITNIISEALADGKKVLFVSEKMAALEVVYKRLSQAGIADFCLSLHNHKAKKKDVLNDLNNTLNMNKMKVKEESLYLLDSLQNYKEKLNAYIKELHTKNMPLNKSIYEVNGILAKLPKTKDIIFSVDKIDEITPQQLNRYKFLLEEFAKTIGEMKEDYETNPWIGCNVSNVSHELRHDIKTNLRKVIPHIKELIGMKNTVTSDFEWNIKYSIKNIREIIETLKFIEKTPNIPIEWIYKSNVNQLIEKANIYMDLFMEHRNIHNEISNDYSDDYFNISSKKIYEEIEELVPKIFQKINNEIYGEMDLIINDFDSIIDNLGVITEKLTAAKNYTCTIAKKYGFDEANSIKELYAMDDLLKDILKNPKPTEMWFDNLKDTTIVSLLHEAKILHEEIKSIKKKLSNDFIQEIYEVKSKEILTELKENKDILELIAILFNVNNGEVTTLMIEEFINKYSYDLKNWEEGITNIHLSSNKVSDILGLDKCDYLSDVKSLHNQMKIISHRIRPTEKWFDLNEKSNILKFFKEIENIHMEIGGITDQISSKYKEDIFNINCDEMLKRFKTEYNSIFRIFKKNYKRDINLINSMAFDGGVIKDYSQMLELLNLLSVLNSKKKKLSDKKDEINVYIGINYDGESTQWDLLDKKYDDFISLVDTFPLGFVPKQLKQAMINDTAVELIAKDFEVIEKYFHFENNLDIKSTIFPNGEDIELNEMIYKLVNINHSINDIKDIFTKFEKMRINKYNGKGLSLSCLRNVLDYLRKIEINQEWMINHEHMLKLAFGTHYLKEYTDWNEIENALNIFKNIKNTLGNKIYSSDIKNLLLSGEENKEGIIIASNKISDLKTNTVIEKIEKVFNYQDDIRILNVEWIIDQTNGLLEDIKGFKNLYDNMSKCSNEKYKYTKYINDLERLQRVQEVEELLKTHNDGLREEFLFFYDGINTDWDSIMNSLMWTSKFIKLHEKYHFTDTFIRKVCAEKSFSEVIYSARTSFEKKIELFKNEWDWFEKLFNTHICLSDIELDNLIVKLENCLNGLAYLEEWIDFRSCREKCYKEGLGEYIEKAEKANIFRTQLVNAFLKRFYRLWLDAITPNYPAVSSFRRRSQEDVIEEFKNLDVIQLAIARSRIKARLVSKLPDLNRTTSAIDELGILKRELGKQRKLMSLRKLFKAIPNLLMSLKPCLMMSPLSVSLFLQADGYNFDMVIFDEASQVCTEDAVGAMMRGKQIIIAGDNKQLPPTNFFGTTVSEGDFDIDDEENYDDSDGFESILDESLTFLPERTLNWHYRSRHEHLIAFSNAKIYKHSLVTFPSSFDKVKDNGVEYIYVPDGIYDRGGKKNNINEAKKVAQLVLEHIKNFPNRSLGVVTFSSSQQQAVENVIRQIRLNNQQYEEFFNEDKEDAFFVKNLENVQGDERDTIIFSIGYAKDHNGVMYMNFGPLSRNGGFRRLNVAITRAKYNIKLVGSIYPTDIDIDKTNSEGVKMLRSYIDFAINGESVLKNELTYNNSVEVESPFEEAVYDFLIENGYSVATQVGCSGYRIDLAVRHPKLSGRFVLGVECDGATYHSARTARERDRIRQTVLEDIGWKIYRIWSTDWIKDPKTEGERLLEHVIKCIEEYAENELDSYNQINENSCVNLMTEEFLDVEGVNDDAKDQENPYGFKYYIESDVYEVERNLNDKEYLADLVKHVVKIEAPIHFELLCKRLACIFGRQKATSVVKKSVKSINDLIKNEIVIKENFYWDRETTKVEVRIPNHDEKPRPINYICIEEVAESMFIIAKTSFGITKDSLQVATARALGFNRSGKNINISMEEAYQYLLSNKKVEIIDDKLIVV